MVGTKLKHVVFFIVSDMNRNMILNLTCWQNKKWHKFNFLFRDLRNLLNINICAIGGGYSYLYQLQEPGLSRNVIANKVM